MRRPLIAGNWKMNLGHADALRLADGIFAGIDVPPDRDCAIFPPFTSLQAIAEKLRSSPIKVGGQNCHPDAEGAFTGEIACSMLKAAGASMVILGHSERRHLLGETDAFVNRKVKAALAARLKPILCVGETLAERDAGRTADVVLGQVRRGLDGVATDAMRDVVLAYEPVWAIGTGKTATPAQAQDVHAAIRGELALLFGKPVAEDTLIL